MNILEKYIVSLIKFKGGPGSGRKPGGGKPKFEQVSVSQLLKSKTTNNSTDTEYDKKIFDIIDKQKIPHKVFNNLDRITIVDNHSQSEYILAEYKPKGRINKDTSIQFSAKGNLNGTNIKLEDTVPHELGHHIFYQGLTETRQGDFFRFHKQTDEALKFENNAKYNYEEHFAEGTKMFFQNKKKLKKLSPQTFEFINEAITNI
jgi:hypothetical protein